MQVLKEYKSEHYDTYITNADAIISNYTDINELIIGITNKTLLLWLRASNIMTKNNNKYFEESAIMLTLVIKLFKMELAVEEIKLNDEQIEKIFNRFHKILKEEFLYRRKLPERKCVYTLLKDFESEV
ncbi:MAG: hypothetical protein HC836_36390 [Richelia sp. RM2_1_2]|nr:hypothetical protein [Richelia sp. RM2_1_2]